MANAPPVTVTNSCSTTESSDTKIEGLEGKLDRSTAKKEADVEAQGAPTLQANFGDNSRLARLPTWISFWLGYRKTPPPPEKNHIVWIWSFIGAFTCISIIQALFGNVPYFVEKGVPSIGATAILLYGAIESPLSQPRPVVGGHLIGALTGVAITKLFLLLPTEERYDELSWLAGSICCAVALVFMQMTGTMHPPAGATALLAASSPDIRRIGWLYIPVVLLASSIALVVALFSNNMQRRYPTFWWTPPPTVAPSFFPTLQLSRTLTKTWTWASKSKTLTSWRVGSRKRKTKRNASANHAAPTADQDWHFALKNHSKIFGGRTRSIASRNGSRSRDSSRARQARPVHPGTITPVYPHGILHHDSPSACVSPQDSTPTSPMSLSPPGSAAVSRRPSTDDLHVGFQVQPMHHHRHHGHGSLRHSYQHHHSHHPSPQTNYLRYLAMKREGTLPPGAATSGVVTPTEPSTPVSRVASVDGLEQCQEKHAQQLIEAVASAKREREEQDQMEQAMNRANSSGGGDESQWEDIEEEEQDLGMMRSGLVIRRFSKRGDESV